MQSRGRSERLFQTLQDRVPLELAGIATMEAANARLRDTYIPAHDARVAIKVEQEGSAFVAGFRPRFRSLLADPSAGDRQAVARSTDQYVSSLYLTWINALSGSIDRTVILPAALPFPDTPEESGEFR